MDSDTLISTLAAADIDTHLGELGALLHACVHDGASIGFVLPHSVGDSAAFWVDKVRPGVQAGSRVLLVARRGAAARSSDRCSLTTTPRPTSRTAPRCASCWCIRRGAAAVSRRR